MGLTLSSGLVKRPAKWKVANCFLVVVEEIKATFTKVRLSEILKNLVILLKYKLETG